MKFDFLSDLKIIDLTTRLPGPLSTYVLESLGAQIIKLEDSSKGSDPFCDPTYLQYAPNFLDWYQHLNQNKKILSLDFKQEPKKLNTLISNVDIILIPDSSFHSNLVNECRISPKVTIKLSGGKDEWKFLHDLNALAASRTFSGHNITSESPPYLPFAGMNFGVYISTFILAALRSVEKENKSICKTLYLKDVTELIFNVFASELSNRKGLFLHSGAFPCYQIYKTKDHHTICFAAIEEKYWLKFTDLFSLKLTSADRFDDSGKTHTIIKKTFAQRNLNEVEEIINHSHICVTTFKREG